MKATALLLLLASCACGDVDDPELVDPVDCAGCQGGEGEGEGEGEDVDVFDKGTKREKTRGDGVAPPGPPVCADLRPC